MLRELRWKVSKSENQIQSSVNEKAEKCTAEIKISKITTADISVQMHSQLKRDRLFRRAVQYAWVRQIQ